jgi:hypothetical protein
VDHFEVEMLSKLRAVFLACCLLLQAQAFETKDLEHAFKIDEIHAGGGALVTALQHEKSLVENKIKNNNENKNNNRNNANEMYISCTNYHGNRKLKSALDQSMGESAFHPVFFSERSNRVCYTFNTDSVHPSLNRNGIQTTLVPHTLKLGSEFHLVFDRVLSASSRNHHHDLGMFVMEFGVGVGVLGKGLKDSAPDLHERVFGDLMSGARRLHSSSDARSSHTDSFFWTSSKTSHLFSPSSSETSAMISEVRTNRRQQYLQSFSRPCDFSSAKMEVLESHITLTMRLSASESHLSQAGGGGLHHPLCVLQLASLASLHSDITHVIFHSAEKILETERTETVSQLTSDPYDTGLPATDQNQYVQSGSELLTPYSDIGIDGTGYVLGMIDTGLDDLSCFLIDTSLTATTRTPGADYATPITESYRRK